MTTEMLRMETELVLSCPFDEGFRIQWVSDAARNHWEPVFQRIRNGLQQLERVRRSFISTIPLAELPEFTKKFMSAHFCVLEVKNNSAKILVTHAPISFFDNVHLGLRLAYPRCCVSAFDRNWRAGHRDLFYEQNLVGKRDWNLYCNLFHRYLGLRLVFHLPCSRDCEETVQIAKQYALWLQDNGFSKEREELEQILQWPVLWDSNHGISTVTTPVYKITAKSDYHPSRVEIKYPGTVLPEHTAPGLGFPFRYTVNAVKPISSDIWTANGFSNLQEMDRAHSVVFPLLKSYKGRDILVVDLGCGNGILLQRIHQKFGFRTLGYDDKKTGHNIETKDIDQWDVRCNVAVISRNRLRERPLFIKRLMEYANVIIVYSYNGRLSGELLFEMPNWCIADSRAEGESYEAYRLERTSVGA